MVGYLKVRGWDDSILWRQVRGQSKTLVDVTQRKPLIKLEMDVCEWDALTFLHTAACSQINYIEG